MKNCTIYYILLTIVFYSFTTLHAEEFFAASASEVNSAMISASPGDTITLRNGRWTDQHIELKEDAAENAPILIRAQTPGQVVLDGSSRLSIGGDYLIVDGLYFLNGALSGDHVVRFRAGSGPAHFSRLTNTAIVNYNPPSTGTRYFWVSLYGTNNRVDHCYFSNQNHSGVTVVAWLDGIPTNHRIDHNHFDKRPAAPNGENGWETIRIGTSSESNTNSRVTVEYNYFYKCDGEIEIISDKSNENIHRYNTFVDCEGTLTMRHGKRCRVEGNFFFGYNAARTGGVRIYDRDHVIINNYFAGLTGDGTRAGLAMMNGTPNSPLNGHFQVINTMVAFNTFVDCFLPMEIGAINVSTQSQPPLDNFIANNVIQGDGSRLINYNTEPINMMYESNLAWGASLGIDPQDGITEDDPKLVLAADSLYRPAADSPAINGAGGSFGDIVIDMDGQSRDTLSQDIGADEMSSDPITIRPLTPADVGLNWELPGENVIQVPPGHNTLQDSLLNARPFDVFELQSGEYTLDEKLIINMELTFRAADSMQKPVLRQINPNTSTRIIFEIQNGGSLIIDGLELDGMAGTATPAKYLIRTDDNPFPLSYKLKVENSYLHDVVIGEDGNFFRAYAGTFADSVIFNNCLFKNSGKEGIRLRDEADDSGLYNVAELHITNCTFWETTKEAIFVYAGDGVPFTPGPRITIDHCTFDNCGDDNSRVIYPRECDFTVIKNSIFSNSPNNEQSLVIEGTLSSVSYSNMFNVGPIETNRNGTIGSGMLETDPLYLDRLNGDFTLAENSPLRGAAEDGQAMGDLRWAKEIVGIGDDIVEGILPEQFELRQNYPNPFNPSTIIEFAMKSASAAEISIYNQLGQQIQTIANGQYPAGVHRINWDAADLPAGVYYYRLTVEGQMVAAKKALLIK